MLSSIVRFSIRFRGIIVALACVLFAYGIYTLAGARYDVFPEFAPAQVVIQTQAPGLSPEQVEVLVTQPIENVINGVVGISSMRSKSMQGISVITVTFKAGSGIYRDRQLVAERLPSISGDLPSGVKPPVMTPLTSSTSVIMAVGMTSDSLSLMKLRTEADWTVKPGLLAVPGVAKIAVYGGEVKEFQVQVNPDKLLRYGLSVNEVEKTAENATGVRGAGFVDTENQRITIRTEGQSLTAAELGNTVVRQRNGADLFLKDVARVVKAPEPQIGTAQIMGHPGVLLIISAQYGANTLRVTREVDSALNRMSGPLTKRGVVLHRNLFRAARFINTAVENMRASLLLGGLLIVVVLLLFLFNLRTAAISLTVIPLSLLTAVIVLQSLGYSLNTMTLGGLAIAIGEVVDDAVIDVENILRRLRENRDSGSAKTVFRVVLDASVEVRSAVVYATFAVALVFVPVLTMTGLAGRLFSPLALAYIFSILASLLFALTVTPALCYFLLGRFSSADVEPAFTRRIRILYLSVLEIVERHFRPVIAAVVLLIAGGAALVPVLRDSFLPKLREDSYILHMTEVPGTSLSQTLALGQRVTRRVLRLPFVKSMAQDAGRAELSDDSHGTHQSEFLIELKRGSKLNPSTAEEEIRDAVSQFIGAKFSINSVLAERIHETLSGYTSSVVVNVFGTNLDSLDLAGEEVAHILRKVRGAEDVLVQSPPGEPQIVVSIRRSRLNRWDFTPVQVMDAVRTAYAGDVVGQVYDGNRVFNVAVILDRDARHNPAAVGNLLLRNPNGKFLRLNRLSRVSETSGRYVILHDGARRVQTITCNVTGRSASSFVSEAKKLISSEAMLPNGTYLEYGGTAEAQASSRHALLVHSLLAGIGIILLLSFVMGNLRNLSLVLANLPFALVGGVIATFITGGTLSIGSLVGFVTLFGITLRNSIMLISHYEHLVRKEGMTWSLDAAIRGASERFVPIMMTAAVTGLGLLPLALASGTAGREIEGPMAIVILGGLFTSTTLNLLVLPTLAARFGKFGKEELIEE